MGHRTWIKIFCDGWLRGSIRKESLEVRSVFVDLLTLAGDSAYGDAGIIQLAEGVGFTDGVIAGILHISIEVWLRAKEILSNHPDPDENRIEIISVDQGFIIKIINWKKYQGEYVRQKVYRKKLQSKLQSKLQKRLHREGEGEREREGEGEGEREEDIVSINPTQIELQILKELKKVKNYPYKFKDTLLYVRELMVEFPELNHLEEMKKKCAWWIDNPLTKAQNPHLQLRNWFRIGEEKRQNKEKFQKVKIRTPDEIRRSLK